MRVRQYCTICSPEKEKNFESRIQEANSILISHHTYTTYVYQVLPFFHWSKHYSIEVSFL
jgi:hypothetical protein